MGLCVRGRDQAGFVGDQLQLHRRIVGGEITGLTIECLEELGWFVHLFLPEQSASAPSVAGTRA